MSKHDQNSFKGGKSEWLSPYEFAKAILIVAQRNPDGRASYTEIWTHLRGEPPSYPSFFRRFNGPFAKLGVACGELNLPYISALIVAKATRKPSGAAINNMWGFAKTHGITDERQKVAFVTEQAEKASALTLRDLDEAFGQLST